MSTATQSPGPSAGDTQGREKATAAARVSPPNEGMRLSDKGLALIKEFEGYHRALDDGRAQAYLCPAGVPTIGWGCTKGVKLGMIVSRAEAEAMLRRELGYFEVRVGALVTVPLAQYEFDALVSFAYNVGDGALAKSTLLKLLNKGDKRAVPNQLLRWTRGGGRELKGLVRRRKAEAALFIANGAPLRGEAADYGAMPQQVEAVKGSRIEALKGSRTIWSALVSLSAWIGAKAIAALGFVADAGSEAQTSVDGLSALWRLLGANGEAMATIVGVVALIAVVAVRLDAAGEEKIG